MSSDLSPLEQSLVATLCYFDTLDYPVSTFELWKYRAVYPQYPQGASLSEVTKSLRGMVLRSVIVECRGHWCLPGREELFARGDIARVEVGRQRRRTARIGRWFSFIPFLRGVVVSGSVASGSVHDGSDVDVLVVARHGYIWTVRLWCVVVFHLLGLRRRGGKVAGRVCLNHFVTDASLEIQHKSMYNAQTYARWLSLFDRGIVEDLFLANRGWISRYVVMPQKNTQAVRWVALGFFVGKFFVWVWEVVFAATVGRWIEGVAEKVQRWYIQKHPVDVRPGRVVLSSEELEFHPCSPEWDVLDRANTLLCDSDLGVYWQDSGLEK